MKFISNVSILSQIRKYGNNYMMNNLNMFHLSTEYRFQMPEKIFSRFSIFKKVI